MKTMVITHLIKRVILSPLYSFLLALTSWRTPDSLSGLEYYKPYTLRIPTYEHSGQAVHPDIVRGIPGAPSIVMSFTPYPFSMDEYENPSIAVSDDGLHFRTESPAVNPIAVAPVKDHNDDPDLFYEDGSWCMLYLETLRPEKQNLRILKSRDRISWSNAILKETDLLDANGPFMLSPAYIRAKGRSLIFYVNMKFPGYRIERVGVGEKLSSCSGPGQPVDIDMKGLHPWHIDVVQSPTWYYMLISVVESSGSGRKTYRLHVARSADLERWELSDKRLLENSYRASGFVSGNDMYVYYSREYGLFDAWKIGIYKIRLSDFFGDES